MDSDTCSRIKDIFRGAMALPEEKRPTYLDLACDANTKLRREVESLLASAPETAGAVAATGPGPESAHLSISFSETSSITAEEASTERAGPKGAPGHAHNPDPVGIVGVTLDARYLVEHLVDEGGFGYVYRAEHILWRKPVAIKLFKSLTGVKHEALKEAFVKEGALLNDLSRKTNSIVQSYDIGTWRAANGEALLFTVLEWLDGRTLQATLEDERKLGGAWGWPVQRVAATLGPIAEALEVAHQSRIAHRDIKPSNIFLAHSPDAKGIVPKLLDFGVAKVAGDQTRGFETTGQGIAACSIGYAAPEQLSRSYGPTGPWTDVYGLALVTVELLCGRPTIASGEISEVVAATTNPRVRPTPRQFGTQLSDAIEAVFERALAVTAADRYQSAGEFWNALSAEISSDDLGYPEQTARSPGLSFAAPPSDAASANAASLSAPAVSGTAGKAKAPPARGSARRAVLKYASACSFCTPSRWRSFEIKTCSKHSRRTLPRKRSHTALARRPAAQACRSRIGVMFSVQNQPLARPLLPGYLQRHVVEGIERDPHNERYRSRASWAGQRGAHGARLDRRGPRGRRSGGYRRVYAPACPLDRIPDGGDSSERRARRRCAAGT